MLFSEYTGDTYSTQEESHGRRETRLHLVSDVTDNFFDFGFEWKGLKKLCVALSFRKEIDDISAGDVSIKYTISSKDLSAKSFSESIRSHWQIENNLHWKLDICLNEDASRIRRGNSPEIMSRIRHIALNFLSAEKGFKAGVKRKQKKAALNENYDHRYLRVF